MGAIARGPRILWSLRQNQTDLRDGFVFPRSSKVTALSSANEEMQDDVLVRSISRMPVVFPVPDVLIDLDVPANSHPIDKHLGAAEVWTWLTVPNSKIDDLHSLSVFAMP